MTCVTEDWQWLLMSSWWWMVKVCDIGWPQAPGPCSEPSVKCGMLRPVSLSAPTQHTASDFIRPDFILCVDDPVSLSFSYGAAECPSVKPPWSKPPGPGSGKTFWLITYSACRIRVYALPHSGPSVRRLRLQRDSVTHLTGQVTLRHLIQQIGNKRNEASNSQEWS